MRKNIDLDAFYDEKLSNKFERNKLAVMNPKAQAMFAHILVDASFIYLLLANKNTQVGANGIQWVNEITRKKGLHVFFVNFFFSNEWILKQMFLQLVIINAYNCPNTW